MTLELLNRPGAPAITTGASGGRLQNQRQQRRHVLDLDDFSVPEIEAVLQTTTAMKDVLQRPIKKVPTLRGKTLVTLFYEASTRTRVAFELAAKALGADTVSVAASTSSVTKGESLIDSVPTSSSFATTRPAHRTSSPAKSPLQSSTPATAGTRTRPRRCWTCSPSVSDSDALLDFASRSSATSCTVASRARTSGA